MLKTIKHQASILLATALLLSLTAAPTFASDHQTFWFAKGDPAVPQGQLWVNPFGECWQSAHGPGHMPPCPAEEPAHEPVPEQFTVRLNFEFDRYQIENVVNRDELANLDRYIQNVLASEANEFLTVVGHTDSVGSQAYNYTLGMNRARAVRDYLISQGVPANRIAPPASRGKLDLLPDYAPDSVYQRRVVIHAQ